MSEEFIEKLQELINIATADASENEDLESAYIAGETVEMLEDIKAFVENYS